jgi:hypothetical protein
VCFRVICCWSHCVFSHHPSFFLVFLLRLHQTLACRNHLPCFSPSVTSNPSAPQPSSLFFSFGYIKLSQRHKPSQRRFVVFLLRLRKKTETKEKKFVKVLARFSENFLIFCRPHLNSVLGETSCSSYFVAPCAEKNIKKSYKKEKQNHM